MRSGGNGGAVSGGAGKGAGGGVRPPKGARPGGGTISRVSVERPLWRALTAFRVASLVYAIARLRGLDEV